MQSNKLFSVWSTESRYLLIYFISSSLHLEIHMRIVVLISDSQTVKCKEILYLGRLEASANKYWMSWILKYVWYFCCQKVCIIHRIVGWSLWGVEKWVGGRGWSCGHCVSIEFDDFNIFAALYRWNVATRGVFTVCLNYNLYLSTRQKILSFSGP